jgi:predicted transcriptional regulator
LRKRFKVMEIKLTAEQAAQLSAIAAQVGKGADEVAQDVFLRGLAAEADFIAAVKVGQDAARRGDFIEQSEVWSDVEKLLQS